MYVNYTLINHTFKKLHAITYIFINNKSSVLPLVLSVLPLFPILFLAISFPTFKRYREFQLKFNRYLIRQEKEDSTPSTLYLIGPQILLILIPKYSLHFYPIA